MAQPNALSVFWGIIRIFWTVDSPNPRGSGGIDPSPLSPILKSIGAEGAPDLSRYDSDLEAYIDGVSPVDPDTLSETGALAFWLNLYNAGALRLAAEAQEAGHTSVLRIPGAFSRPIFEVAGESLSLDGVEHGKVRRFGDPRIHSALVCGSVSCPTLRDEPYEGERLEAQLEEQMRAFLESGGAAVDDQGQLNLNKIFLWYGSDFVRPHRMPTLVPSSKAKVAAALEQWTDQDLSTAQTIEFQSYDWGLRCTLG